MPDPPADSTDNPVSHPAGRHVPSIMLFVVCVVVVLVCDLALKSWSFANVAGVPVILDPLRPDLPDIPPHPAINLVPYVLSMKLWTNTGAVFGFGKGAQGFFIVVSFIATAAILYIFSRSEAKARVSHVALAMILAGTLGNLYDRTMFNAVRDMLWLFPEVYLPFGLTWPGGRNDVYPWLFNIADAALVVGVATILIIMWRTEETGGPESKAK